MRLLTSGQCAGGQKLLSKLRSRNTRDFQTRNLLPALSLRILGYKRMILRQKNFVLPTSINPASNIPRCSDRTSNPKTRVFGGSAQRGTPSKQFKPHTLPTPIKRLPTPCFPQQLLSKPLPDQITTHIPESLQLAIPLPLLPPKMAPTGRKYLV